jgi:hypothetical protein
VHEAEEPGDVCAQQERALNVHRTDSNDQRLCFFFCVLIRRITRKVSRKIYRRFNLHFRSLVHKNTTALTLPNCYPPVHSGSHEQKSLLDIDTASGDFVPLCAFRGVYLAAVD